MKRQHIVHDRENAGLQLQREVANRASVQPTSVPMVTAMGRYTIVTPLSPTDLCKEDVACKEYPIPAQGYFSIMEKIGSGQSARMLCELFSVREHNFAAKLKVNFIKRMLDALRAMDQANVVHADIKPENITLRTGITFDFDEFHAKGGSPLELENFVLEHTFFAQQQLFAQQQHDPNVIDTNVFKMIVELGNKAAGGTAGGTAGGSPEIITEPTLVDFGFARTADANKYAKYASVCGTVEWMAPETLQAGIACRDKKSTGANIAVQSDWWAMGMMFAQLCGHDLQQVLTTRFHTARPKIIDSVSLETTWLTTFEETRRILPEGASNSSMFYHKILYPMTCLDITQRYLPTDADVDACF